MGANTTTWAQTLGGHGVGGVQLPMTKTEWARAMVAMITGMARPAERNRSSVSRTAKGKDDQQAGGSPLRKGSTGEHPIPKQLIFCSQARDQVRHQERKIQQIGKDQKSLASEYSRTATNGSRKLWLLFGMNE